MNGSRVHSSAKRICVSTITFGVMHYRCASTYLKFGNIRADIVDVSAAFFWYEFYVIFMLECFLDFQLLIWNFLKGFLDYATVIYKSVFFSVFF